MSILELPQKQNGHLIECITILTFISPPKCSLSHLHVWRLVYGLLPIEKLAEPLLVIIETSAKYQTGKWQNRKLFLFSFLFLRNFLRLHNSIILVYGFHSKNNTNEPHILVSSTFLVNKDRQNNMFPFSWLVNELQRPHTGISSSSLLWSAHTKFYEE